MFHYIKKSDTMSVNISFFERVTVSEYSIMFQDFFINEL